MQSDRFRAAGAWGMGFNANDTNPLQTSQPRKVGSDIAVAAPGTRSHVDLPNSLVFSAQPEDNGILHDLPAEE